MLHRSAHAWVKNRNGEKTKRVADSGEGNKILVKNPYVGEFFIACWINI